jgi:hypothetical protein
MFAAGVQTIAAAVLLSLFGPTCRAQDWVEHEEGLGFDEFKFLVAGGLDYSWVFGSEVEQIDPSLGFWATGAYRIGGAFSVCASILHNSASIDGRMSQLLDVPIRPDGKSGFVEGDMGLMRFGAGVRLDAFRTQAWKYRPYVQAEIIRSMIDVTLDSVDGASPADDDQYTRSSFDASQWGALARVGVDYRLTPMIGIDVGGIFEILEFPAGTASIASIAGGATFRF